ncbi:GH25 family lysozyme [Lactobacillus sp. Sy-1]|uniref:GH25 family lysozyme n=1 Tax=Lactobacillus sp. Sy-1 TaxID=2109645 RepID=UPI001C5B478C|nr:GH25 family lysozyme [Lactobacillus sp. Sy-1]MBW1606441.1 1,4-beta-N-acetylmuramidase [Lactobacillus sp. Sy-1]
MVKKMDLIADVASYQPDTLEYFSSLKSLGVKAVIIKVTQGSKYGDCYLNPKAKSQVANARKAGLKVHGYHYARFISTVDAQGEADWFIECIKKVGLKPESVMALDVEDASIPKGDITPLINAFNARMIKAGYKRLDVYSMASWFWAERIHPYALKPKMNLWVANYTTAGKPGLDDVGTWQFTDKYKGMNLDMSYDFKGWYTK